MAITTRNESVGRSLGVIFFSLCLLGSDALALDKSEEDYTLKLLGKYVFFDNISSPQRMGCITCHDPATGGTGSVAGVNLHQVAITGANPHTVGSLKPPTNTYASLIPAFDACDFGAPPSGQFCGGNFWNGRAEGRGAGEGGALFPAGATKHIGDEVFQGIDSERVRGYAKYFGPTSDQALNPMPNPVEQNIDRQAVCAHVAAAGYAELYELAWETGIDCRDTLAAISAPDVESPEREFDISFKRLMLAVGAWQHSAEVNSFSSKRDRALRAELDCLEGAADADPEVCNHEDFINSPGTFPLVGLTAQENLGHDLFYNSRPNPRFSHLPVSNCSFCHSDNPDTDDGAELRQLYTDNAYHNIGTPANPELPAEPDPGLVAHTGAATAGPGFYRTPTMRNVDKRPGDGFIKAYAHNGWFKSLESIVHFYNTAAVKPSCPDDVVTEREALANDCWPAPEHDGPGIAIPFLLGDLGMSPEHEAAIVAYLKTFTDRVTPSAPRPYRSARR